MVLGMVLASAKEYERSLRYYDAALKDAQGACRSRLLLRKGQNLYSMGRYEEAAPLITESRTSSFLNEKELAECVSLLEAIDRGKLMHYKSPLRDEKQPAYAR
jgi:tetratricopeptide (TPR) repeat protein